MTTISKQKRQETHVWLQDLTDLMDQIESWAKAKSGWSVERQQRHLNESRYGEYDAPQIFIHTGQIKLYVTPIGRDIPGCEGRVDLETFPGLIRMMLLREKGQWKIKTDSYVDWPEEWNRETFYKLISTLSKTS